MLPAVTSACLTVSRRRTCGIRKRIEHVSATRSPPRPLSPTLPGRLGRLPAKKHSHVISGAPVRPRESCRSVDLSPGGKITYPSGVCRASRTGRCPAQRLALARLRALPAPRTGPPQGRVSAGSACGLHPVRGEARSQQHFSTGGGHCPGRTGALLTDALHRTSVSRSAPDRWSP